jgi:hypothetical protein
MGINLSPPPPEGDVVTAILSRAGSPATPYREVRLRRGAGLE